MSSSNNNNLFQLVSSGGTGVGTGVGTGIRGEGEGVVATPVVVTGEVVVVVTGEVVVVVVVTGEVVVVLSGEVVVVVVVSGEVVVVVLHSRKQHSPTQALRLHCPTHHSIGSRGDSSACFKVAKKDAHGHGGHERGRE